MMQETYDEAWEWDGGLSVVRDLARVVVDLRARGEWDVEAGEARADAYRPDREVDAMSDMTPAEWWDMGREPSPGEDFDLAAARVAAAVALADYLAAEAQARRYNDDP